MDDLNNKIEENLPEDEYIRSVAIRSRNIEEVYNLLVMVTAQIAEMKEIKNGPLYRRKVVLRSYEAMLKERFRYLRVSKNRKNKDRQIAKLSQNKLNEVIADKLIKTTLKQQRVSNAQKVLAIKLEAQQDILSAQEELFKSQEETKAQRDFNEKIKLFIEHGSTPAEALRKASRGDMLAEATTIDKLVSLPSKDIMDEVEQDKELNPVMPSFDVLNEDEPLTKQKPLIATPEQIRQAQIENEQEDLKDECERNNNSGENSTSA